MEAVSNDSSRKTESNVIINIVDVNDHSPQFVYKVSIMKSNLLYTAEFVKYENKIVFSTIKAQWRKILRKELWFLS